MNQIEYSKNISLSFKECILVEDTNKSPNIINFISEYIYKVIEYSKRILGWKPDENDVLVKCEIGKQLTSNCIIGQHYTNSIECLNKCENILENNCMNNQNYISNIIECTELIKNIFSDHISPMIKHHISQEHERHFHEVCRKLTCITTKIFNIIEIFANNHITVDTIQPNTIVEKELIVTECKNSTTAKDDYMCQFKNIPVETTIIPTTEQIKLNSCTRIDNCCDNENGVETNNLNNEPNELNVEILEPFVEDKNDIDKKQSINVQESTVIVHDLTNDINNKYKKPTKANVNSIPTNIKNVKTNIPKNTKEVNNKSISSKNIKIESNIKQNNKAIPLRNMKQDGNSLDKNSIKQNIKSLPLKNIDKKIDNKLKCKLFKKNNSKESKKNNIINNNKINYKKEELLHVNEANVKQET